MDDRREGERGGRERDTLILYFATVTKLDGHSLHLYQFQPLLMFTQSTNLLQPNPEPPS